MRANAPTVSVIVLAFGEEPYLATCIAALLDTTSADTQLLVVDNGAAKAVSALPAENRLDIIRPKTNLGFAGGCNEAARHAGGRTLVFVNSDAIVRPGAVATLVAGLDDPSVGLVSGGVRLADDPQTMNTVGNPVHYLGVVWAGGYGDKATAHPRETEIASASGAFMAIRRDRWESLGGFDDAYFAYHEDTDLSLRCWQRGWRVLFEPTAVATHHYEFSRNPNKQYLLERNRWLTVLTVYPSVVLLAVLPMMVIFELALVPVAAVQGWLPEKARGWGWLVRHAGTIRQRRKTVQSVATISVADFTALLSSKLEPAMIERPPGLGLLNAVLATYWSVARRLVLAGAR